MSKTKNILYIGTLTRYTPYFDEANGEGIYAYDFNSETGELKYLSETQGIDNPTYMTLDRTGNFLYADSEIFGWDEGLVKSYKINQQNGSLEYINMQPTHGSVTSYVSVDHSNSFLLLTNFWSGSVVLFRRMNDGGLSEVLYKVQHKGHSLIPEEKGAPHPHCVIMEKSNSFAYVADLGLDKVICYRLDHKNQSLKFSSEIDLPIGSGPRHFIFHPSGKFAYMTCEASSKVAAFKVDSSSGALEIIDLYETLPSNFTGENQCSDIQITASGKFLYAGNRGHDSIAAFSLDEDSGKLVPAGCESTQGRTPRNFVIDPSDQFLLAANQDSDNIKIFSISPVDGKLAFTGKSYDIPTPMCLKFLQI